MSVYREKIILMISTFVVLWLWWERECHFHDLLYISVAEVVSLSLSLLTQMVGRQLTTSSPTQPHRWSRSVTTGITEMLLR